MEQNAAPQAEQKVMVEKAEAGRSNRQDAARGRNSSNVPRLKPLPEKSSQRRPCVAWCDAGIDLNQISGTGIGGRITEKDVQAFSSSGARSGLRTVIDREPPLAARLRRRTASDWNVDTRGEDEA